MERDRAFDFNRHKFNRGITYPIQWRGPLLEPHQPYKALDLSYYIRPLRESGAQQIKWETDTLFGKFMTAFASPENIRKIRDAKDVNTEVTESKSIRRIAERYAEKGWFETALSLAAIECMKQPDNEEARVWAMGVVAKTAYSWANSIETRTQSTRSGESAELRRSRHGLLGMDGLEEDKREKHYREQLEYAENERGVAYGLKTEYEAAQAAYNAKQAAAKQG